MDSKFLYLVDCQDSIAFDIFIKSTFPDMRIVKTQSVSTCINAFFAKSFLQKDKACYVVYDETDLDTYFSDIAKMAIGQFQNNNILVYRLSKIDKRSKLYKQYKSLIITPTYKPNDIAKLIFSESVSAAIINTLYDKTNSSISRLYSELIKSKHLFETGNYSSIDDAITIVANELTEKSESNIFALISIIANKDLDKLKKYLQTTNTSEFDFGLFSLIYTQFRNMYIVKDAGIYANPESTGLSQFVINACKNYIRKYSVECLNNILTMLFDIDIKIKTGQLDSSCATDLMLVRLLSCEN